MSEPLTMQWWVGVRDVPPYEVFRDDDAAHVTSTTYPNFERCVGPFTTEDNARYYAEHYSPPVRIFSEKLPYDG